VKKKYKYKKYKKYKKNEHFIVFDMKKESRCVLARAM